MRDTATRGETFDPARDGARISGHLAAVRDFCLGRDWLTLGEIAEAVHVPEASVSARLRDLRKLRYGAHEVLRRRRSAGLWEYRVRSRA